MSTPGAEIAGVAAEGRETVTFTTSAADGSFAQVKRVLPNGKVRAVGDLVPRL